MIDDGTDIIAATLWIESSASKLGRIPIVLSDLVHVEGKLITDRQWIRNEKLTNK